MSIAKILHAFFLCWSIVNSHGESLGVFDDNVLFDISWPGFLPKNDALEVDTKVEVQIFASQTSILVAVIAGERRCRHSEWRFRATGYDNFKEREIPVHLYSGYF